MSRMQKLQPKMKELQDLYADDKAKLNEEMMLLYKQNNVNPLSGCMPLLLQLPIMILLFRVLMRYQVADTVFFGVPLERTVLQSIAAAVGMATDVQLGVMVVLKGILANPSGLGNVSLFLPGVLLIVFISILTWLQQKLSSSASNPQMAYMNTFMPIFMGFICLSLPGGVLVYWGTSSVAGIVQQHFVTRHTNKVLEKEEAEREVLKSNLHKNKPAGQSKISE